MVSGGRIYRNGKTVNILSSGMDSSISEYSFQFKAASDAALAQTILDDAYFTYTWITQFEMADDWNYSCKDTILQIVDATLDWKEQ